MQKECTKPEPWNGVRNFEARNIIKEAKKDDLCLFYESNCKVPGIVGICRVVSETAYPDPSAFDAKDPYYDPKSKPDSPRWFVMDVSFEEKFDRKVTLKEIQSTPTLAEMALVKRGRLSVQRVRLEEFEYIKKMSKDKNID